MFKIVVSGTSREHRHADFTLQCYQDIFRVSVKFTRKWKNAVSLCPGGKLKLCFKNVVAINFRRYFEIVFLGTSLERNNADVTSRRFLHVLEVSFKKFHANIEAFLHFLSICLLLYLYIYLQPKLKNKQYRKAFYKICSKATS